MQRPMKAVQIGAGNFAYEYHAPTLRRLAAGPSPPISLEAICDLSPERADRFCREFGYARAYTDFGRMIDEVRPDLIYVMVHPPATAGVLKAVLPLGIPIFTEKPPGISVTEAESLADLAAKCGALNYVAFNRRRTPGLEHLKAWAESSAPLRYVRAEMLRNRRPETDFAIGTAIHPLDFLRYLCGAAASLWTVKLSHRQSGASDYLIRLEFVSGVIADLSIQVDCGLRRESYLAQASGSSMEVTLGAGYSSAFFTAGEREYRDDRLVGESAVGSDALTAGGFIGEHESFLNSVARGCLPDCCLQDARHSLRLAAAVQSGFTGFLHDFKDPSETFRVDGGKD
jgi:myo-inositol 2-dehydrogenase/D-chiro-inositol 1-dehydrogenase